MNWIVATNQPFNCLENKDFQELMQHLNYTLPFKSASTVKSKIQEQYETRKQIMRASIATAQSISFSFDVWTNPNCLAFMTIIGHWIDDNFKYHEEVLDFLEIVGSHTGENLAALIYPCTEDYNCSNKLLSLTGDNASNNLALIPSLISQHPFNSKFTENGYVRCLAHILNLIAQTILTELKSGDTSTSETIVDESNDVNTSIIVRVRALAIHSTRTPQRREFWRNVCLRLGMESNVIRYDVSTRWNSTYRMLCDAEKCSMQYTKYIEETVGIDHLLLTDNEWKLVKQYVSVLEPFSRLTDMVSQSTSAQITLSLPIYYTLHDILHDVREKMGIFKDVHDSVVQAATKGLVHFEKYYELMDGNDMYFIAATLHPKYKGVWLERQLGDDVGKTIIDHIQSHLETRFSQENTRHVHIRDHSHYDIELLMDIDMCDYRLSKSDIKEYFESKPIIIPSTVAFDVHGWWLNNRNQYPVLSLVAMEYLAIPCSSVSVERLFSSARDVIGIRRYSLLADSIRMLMTLKTQ